MTQRLILRSLVVSLVTTTALSQSLQNFGDYETNVYDRGNFQSQGLDVHPNAEKFFKTCLKIREENKFYNNPDEQLRPPSLRGQLAVPDPLVPDFVAESRRCTDYKCMAQNLERDPRLLERLRCYQNSDCQPSISGMYCRNFRRSDSFCDCPRGQAYNATGCRCQPAEPCLSQFDFCHNGMKCSDQSCSCNEMSKQLYDPHSGFCVEPSLSGSSVYAYDGYYDDGSTETLPESIAAAVLGAIVLVILIAFAIYLCHQYASGTLFQRGDYRCEADETDRPAPKKRVVNVGKFAVPVLPVRGFRRPQRQLASSAEQPHVAAWDLPSLDHLDEEQAVKYLHRTPPESDGTGAATASTVEAGDIGRPSSISSSRVSLQGSPHGSEQGERRRRGHSRSGSVDLRFLPKVELEPDGGARSSDNITTASDIL